jgi:GntR family transcriptional regulator
MYSLPVAQAYQAREVTVMPVIPLYKKIYFDIKQAIKDGKYPVGSFLPAEAELCEQYSASRTTIRKALSILGEEGYLRIKQGRGTEVLEASTTQELSGITSITETLKKKGYEVSVHGMCIQKMNVPDFLTDKLRLPANNEVYKVERLIYADEHPIAYIINYLDAKPLPYFENFTNSFVGLYSFLERKYNVVLMEATETLSACVADFTESQLLHIPVGAPLLCSKRISSINGSPFEYGISKLVADRYEYSIYLKGRYHSE